MRKLLAVLGIALCLVAPAQAQKTKAAMTTEVNTNLPDNTIGAITPAILRATLIDIVNSYYDLNGLTAANCASNQWVSSFPSLSSIACTGTVGLTASTITGTTSALAQAQCGLLVQRSASGSVMTDTLAAGGVSAGCVITLKNVDASAPYEVTVSGGTLDGVSSGFMILGVNQTGAIQFDGTNFHVVNAPTRISSGPSGITLYVAASGGSDSNHGLTSGAPFATRQHCWNIAQEKIDLGGTPLATTAVTCQLLTGTYTDATMQGVGTLAGQGFAAAMTFQGDCTTPSNTIVNTSGISYSADDKAMFALRCQRITTSLASSNLVFAQHAGSLIVALDKLEMLGGASTGVHFVAQIGAGIVISQNYKVLGGGVCAWLATSHGTIITLGSVTVDQTTASINYSTGWACTTDLGYLSGVGLSFTGSSTGPRYSGTNNSIINSGGGGANFFPGNSAGAVSGNAIYE